MNIKILFKFIQNNNLFEKALKYIIFGFGAMVCDFFFFYISYNHLNLNLIISNVFSTFTGIAFSFSFNRIWTFKKRDFAVKRGIKFIIVSLSGLILSTLLLKFMVEIGLSANYAKLIAIGMVAFIQFISNMLWTFK